LETRAGIAKTAETAPLFVLHCLLESRSAAPPKHTLVALSCQTIGSMLSKKGAAGGSAMMGRQDRNQGRLFYEFSLNDMIPAEHLL